MFKMMKSISALRTSGNPELCVFCYTSPFPFKHPGFECGARQGLTTRCSAGEHEEVLGNPWNNVSALTEA